MSVYDDLIDTIVFRMGNRAGLRDQIKREAEIVKRKLEKEVFHPHFLLSEDSYYETVACEARVPFPEKFLAEWEHGALWIENSAGKFIPLQKGSLDVLTVNYPCEGMPKAYAFAGKNFKVFPTPDKPYILRLYCYQGTDLLSNIDNLWLTEGFEWLAWETTAHFAKSTRDHKGWKEYIVEAARAKNELQAISQERMSANDTPNMGEDSGYLPDYVGNDIDRG